MIGWGEGLGFYVQGERAFWALVFWVYAAHVLLTAWLGLRRRGTQGMGRVAPIVAAADGESMRTIRGSTARLWMPSTGPLVSMVGR